MTANSSLRTSPRQFDVIVDAALGVYRSEVTPIDVEEILPPHMGRWPLTRAMARALARLVVGLDRHNVLEFGAGWSSLILARALAARGGGRLTSVEHQPAYAAPAWTLVKAEASVDAALVVTDLHRRVSGHGLLWSYRNVHRLVTPRGPFDLVLIDGPPGTYGRAAPLHDVFASLAPGAVILLDDAGRASEQRVVKRWTATYPGLRLATLDLQVERGIAVLVYDGSPGKRFAPRAIAGTIRDEFVQARQRATRNPA